MAQNRKGVQFANKYRFSTFSRGKRDFYFS
nr:MAG TPA: hypothetical protein [Caudoviricetes sp.]